MVQFTCSIKGKKSNVLNTIGYFVLNGCNTVLFLLIIGSLVVTLRPIFRYGDLSLQVSVFGGGLSKGSYRVSYTNFVENHGKLRTTKSTSATGDHHITEILLLWLQRTANFSLLFIYLIYFTVMKFDIKYKPLLYILKYILLYLITLLYLIKNNFFCSAVCLSIKMFEYLCKKL